MARVTYHGQTFDVPDSNVVLLDYYRGEGGVVVLDEELAARAADLEPRAAVDDFGRHADDAAEAAEALAGVFPQPGADADPAA